METQKHKKMFFAIVSTKRDLFLAYLKEKQNILGYKFFPTPLDAISFSINNQSTILLWLDGERIFKEEVGAIKVLNKSRPNLKIIVEIPEEIELREALKTSLPLENINFVETPDTADDLKQILSSEIDLYLDKHIEKVLNTFISGLSDSLNNSLAKLLGYFQLFEITLKDKLDQKLKDLIKNIKACIKDVEDIIKGLELATGNIIGKDGEIDIKLLIENILDQEAIKNLIYEISIPDNFIIKTKPNIFKKVIIKLIEIGEKAGSANKNFYLFVKKLGNKLLIELNVFLEDEKDLEEDKIFFPFYLSSILRKPNLGIEPSILFGLSKALNANITGFVGENNNLIIRFSVNITQ